MKHVNTFLNGAIPFTLGLFLLVGFQWLGNHREYWTIIVVIVTIAALPISIYLMGILVEDEIRRRDGNN